MSTWNKYEFPEIARKYSCHILFLDPSVDQYKDRSLPSDCRLIYYTVDGQDHMDAVRCKKMADLFDCYYDKFGKGVVKKITLGYGTINPRLWQPPK